MINTKIKGELGYRIEYDVEHNLFHAQNVFSDEYITPTFVEYVQKLEKENAELKEHIKADCIDCADYIKNQKLEKENAELKMKIYGGGYEMIVTKKDADIILLEKQLKEQKEHHKSVCENLTNTHRNIREQLTKAKEIIKFLINPQLLDKPQYYEWRLKAEQFLNDDGCPKKLGLIEK